MNYDDSSRVCLNSKKLFEKSRRDDLKVAQRFSAGGRRDKILGVP